MMVKLDEYCLKSLDEYESLLANIEEIRLSTSYTEFQRQQQLQQDADNNVTLLSSLSLSSSAAAADTHSSLTLAFVLRLSLHAIIMLASLVGNSFVILIIALDRRMHKPANWLILNLAVCDLLILVLCLTLEVANSFSQYWLLGKLFCKLNSYIQVTTVVASVLTLMTIAYDRFAHTVYPLKRRLTRAQIVCCIGLIWLTSLGVAVPSYAYRAYTEQRWSDFVETYCDDLGWPVVLTASSDLDDDDDDATAAECLTVTRPSKRLYHTALIVLLFFLPICAMSFAYGVVVWRLWRMKVVGEISCNHLQMIAKRKKRILMLVWILVVFVACYSPLESLLLYVEYASQLPRWWPHVEWIVYLLAYLNTAINPYIYVGMSANYTSGFRLLTGRLFHRRTLSNRDRFKLAVAAAGAPAGVSRRSTRNKPQIDG